MRVHPIFKMPVNAMLLSGLCISVSLIIISDLSAYVLTSFPAIWSHIHRLNYRFLCYG